MNPKVSIIMPTKNDRFIKQVKEDLSKQTFKDFELLVMDSDEPPAKKRNDGVKKARSDWNVFIDDDVRLHPKWLEELWNSKSKEMIVTGAVTPYSFGFSSHSTTCNCIFHRSMFIPFDESFRKAAHEDKDWFFRMKGTEIVPSAVLNHMDQQMTTIRKNFVFGIEDVKLWKKRRGQEWDHSIRLTAYYSLRNALYNIARVAGIICGLVKYGIVKRND